MRVSRSLAAATVLALGAVLFGATPALAADTHTVGPGGDFTTITDAVVAAAPGDTISIAAGTYQEHSIPVNKPLTIVGAGVGETFVDGQSLTPYTSAGVFTVRAPATGVEAISISGLTIVNAVSFGIHVKSAQATTTIPSITFDNIEIVGTGTNDYGIYADGGRISGTDTRPRQVPPLTLSNSTISGTARQGIGVDTWNGDLLIEDNSLSETTSRRSAILIMNEYTDFRMTAANVVRGNSSTGRLVTLRNDVGTTFGGYDSLTVTDNTISGLTSKDYGISVGTNADSDAAFSRIGTATIMGNTITGDGVSLETSGVLIRGLVENTIVDENDITGVGTGISVVLDKGQSALAVQANQNRLFANNIGVGNTTTAVVDANDNWWGCVDGPTSASEYCSTVSNTGGGTLDTTRWISALASADSPVLAAGDSTEVTGQFGELNTGATIVLPPFFYGLDVTFTADTGSVAPSSGVLDPALSATTTYTAPAAVGLDEVRVAIDRADFPGTPEVGPNLHYGSAVVLGEPIPVAITVNPAPIAPVITSGPPIAAEVDSAYSFQVTATGIPDPTFAITDGTLPTGLTMDAAGLISGTPTTTGEFTFTVTASNGVSPDATATYTLAVEPAPVPPVITSGPPTAAEIDSAYSFQVTATGIPDPTFAITSGTLPTGLMMDAAGLISGTPTATGEFTFTVTAANGVSPDATATYTLTVSAAPVTPTPVDPAPEDPAPVPPVITPGLSVTGTSTAAPLLLGGILTLMIGAGVTLVSRSRRLSGKKI